MCRFTWRSFSWNSKFISQNYFYCFNVAVFAQHFAENVAAIIFCDRFRCNLTFLDFISQWVYQFKLHAHTHTHTHTHTRTYIYIYIYIYTYIYIYVCVCGQEFLYEHIYAYMFTCVHTCLCTCIYFNMARVFVFCMYVKVAVVYMSRCFA